jgi:hypothetical protein
MASGKASSAAVACWVAAVWRRAGVPRCCSPAASGCGFHPHGCGRLQRRLRGSSSSARRVGSPSWAGRGVALGVFASLTPGRCSPERRRGLLHGGRGQGGAEQLVRRGAAGWVPCTAAQCPLSRLTSSSSWHLPTSCKRAPPGPGRAGGWASRSVRAVSGGGQALAAAGQGPGALAFSVFDLRAHVQGSGALACPASTGGAGPKCWAGRGLARPASGAGPCHAAAVQLLLQVELVIARAVRLQRRLRGSSSRARAGSFAQLGGARRRPGGVGSGESHQVTAAQSGAAGCCMGGVGRAVPSGWSPGRGAAGWVPVQALAAGWGALQARPAAVLPAGRSPQPLHPPPARHPAALSPSPW